MMNQNTYSAKPSDVQRNWFIVLFILVPFNDLGIVELIYLFWFAKKRMTIPEIKSWIKRGN